MHGYKGYVKMVEILNLRVVRNATQKQTFKLQEERRKE
jgi:hypothetical protein